MKRITRSTTLLALTATLCVLAVGIVGTTRAGIQGSGFRTMAFGTITGTDAGSIFVNGVGYSTANARATIDGSPASAALLHIGHIVTVNGTLNEDGVTGTADEIAFIGDVRGEIVTRDTAAGTFSVLGQTVHITDETVIEGSAALPVGTVVEVSGFPNSAGELVASRVDIQGAAGNGQLRGTVSGLDANAQTFLINTLLVDYANAQVAGALTEGDIVLVRSTSESADGALEATRVDVLPLAGASGEKGDIEGLITSFASDADFQVGGQRVHGDERTHYILRGTALGPDVAVQVSGTYENGVLNADKVKVKTNKNPN
jgi:hypothetical protein